MERNAYGPQLFSRTAGVDCAAPHAKRIEVGFIRAPHIARVGAAVDVLATDADGAACAVRQRNVVGLTFHPELTGVTHFHQLAFDQLRAASAATAASGAKSGHADEPNTVLTG